MANILIIYGHPKTKKSFNFELKEKLIKDLKEKKHNIIIRDLYGINFNPILSSKDLENIHNNIMPDDIKTEQDFIKNSEYIIFIYPIWWTREPAIIKGYIDRVFAYGFAYKYKDGEVIGLLNDKNAIIINSTGSPYPLYENNGFHKSIKTLVDGGIFGFCEFKKVKHLFYGSITNISETEFETNKQNAIDETIIEIDGKQKTSP